MDIIVRMVMVIIIPAPIVMLHRPSLLFQDIAHQDGDIMAMVIMAAEVLEGIEVAEDNKTK